MRGSTTVSGRIHQEKRAFKGFDSATGEVLTPKSRENMRSIVYSDSQSNTLLVMLRDLIKAFDCT